METSQMKYEALLLYCIHFAIDVKVVISSDIILCFYVFLCQPNLKFAVPVFCQTSSESVVIGRIGALFPHRLNLSL